MKWKKKKGRLRGVGVSGRRFFIENTEGAFAVHVEHVPGQWQMISEWASLHEAKVQALSEDLLYYDMDDAEAKAREARKQSIVAVDELREGFVKNLPTRWIAFFRQYAKANFIERTMMDTALEVSGLEDLSKLAKRVTKMGLF